MRLLASMVGLLLMAGIGSAAIIRVPADSSTIQAGIDGANNSDTVLVAPGTYTGDGNRDLDFRGKSIVLRSLAGPQKTVIDAGGLWNDHHRGFYFHSGEDSVAVVDGFTLTNGLTSGGGAVFCNESSPTFKNCIFDNNRVSYEAIGGAVLCISSASKFIGCEFSNNNAHYGGGIGSRLSEMRLEFCVFMNNTARPEANIDCGGICGTYPGSGGAISSWFTDISLEIINCTFVGNVTHPGRPGCEEPSCDDRLSNGGAVACFGNSTTIINSLFVGNSASFNAAIAGCPTLSCCNIFGNPGGDWVDCLIDQYETNGNISADPMFCNPAAGEYSIHFASPCASENNACELLIGARSVGCECYCSGQGDNDGNGIVDAVDIVYLMNYALRNGEEPPVDQYCPTPNRGDFNCDGYINLVDLVAMINYVYRGPAPGPCNPCVLSYEIQVEK